MSFNSIGSPSVLNYLQFNTGITVAGGQLDFRTAFSIPRQVFQNTSASVLVVNPLLINGPFFMRGSGGRVIQVGDITGAGSFNQGSGPTVPTGTFVTELRGLNSYTGGTFVHNGVLRPIDVSALPDGGNVTVTAGTLGLATFTNYSIGSLTLSRSDATGASLARWLRGTAPSRWAGTSPTRRIPAAAPRREDRRRD